MNAYTQHLLQVQKTLLKWLQDEEFDINFKKAFPLGTSPESEGLYYAQKAKIRNIRFFLAESMQFDHVQVIYKGLNPYTKKLIDEFLSKGNEFQLPRTHIDELIPGITGQKTYRKVLWEGRAQNRVKVEGDRNILIDYIQKVSSILTKGVVCPMDFDLSTGMVFLQGKHIGDLKVNQLPYKFFQILFDSFGQSVSHESLTGELFGKDTNGRARIPAVGYARYCSNIKSQIPEGIIEYIGFTKGNYFLSSSKR